jgi:hypothetical protein
MRKVCKQCEDTLKPKTIPVLGLTTYNDSLVQKVRVDRYIMYYWNCLCTEDQSIGIFTNCPL